MYLTCPKQVYYLTHKPHAYNQMHILNARKHNSGSTHNYTHAGATNHKPISTLNHFQSHLFLHVMHPIVMHAMNVMQCKRKTQKKTYPSRQSLLPRSLR